MPDPGARRPLWPSGFGSAPLRSYHTGLRSRLRSPGLGAPLTGPTGLRRAPVAVRRAAVHSRDPPAPDPEHPVRAFLSRYWIATAGRFFVIRVQTPLPNVTRKPWIRSAVASCRRGSSVAPQGARTVGQKCLAHYVIRRLFWRNSFETRELTSRPQDRWSRICPCHRHRPEEGQSLFD